MLFVEYPKCSTCQKAKRYLEERGAAFEDRPIHTQPPHGGGIACLAGKERPAPEALF